MPIRVEVEGVGTLEFPDDTPDAVIDQAVKRETAQPMPSHGAAPSDEGFSLSRFLGDPGGRSIDPAVVQQAQEAMGGSPLGAARQGATEAAGQAAFGLAEPYIAKAVQATAKVPMRMALGAQAAVRRKFPTVDLERVALREGFSASPAGVRKIGAASRAANEAVPAAGRAADAAGAAPIQPREMTKGLRKLYDRAGQARLVDDQQQIVEAANDLRKRYRGGINVEDSLVAKSEMQNRAKGVLQGAADPRAANTGKKIAGVISRDMASAARGRSPQVADALTRSQELMALGKAGEGVARHTALLRTIMALSAGGGAGAISGDPGTGATAALLPLLLTSPRGLSLAARGIDRLGTPAAREAARLALLGLLGQTTP